MRFPARLPPTSIIAFLGLRITVQMSSTACLTAGTTLWRILGMASTMPRIAAMTAITIRVVLPEESLLLCVSTVVAVIARRAEEEEQLDRATDAGAEDHGARCRRDGHAFLVEVVELEPGAADSLRRDEVQEAARELGEHRGDEGEVPRPRIP